MARIHKGILGPIQGTVGTVVGANWKGIYYIRSQSAETKHKSTIDQLDHQLRFSLVINFVSILTDLLKITFKKYAVKMSETNAAFSYNFYNAVTGIAPDYEINFEKALVSRGDLPNANAIAASVTGTSLYFKWLNNAGAGSAADTDKAVLVAYCKNKNQVIFNTNSADRKAGAATLDVTNFTGETIQTWLAFFR